MGRGRVLGEKETERGSCWVRVGRGKGGWRGVVALVVGQWWWEEQWVLRV